MTQETRVTKRDDEVGIFLLPDEVLANAMLAAKALADVISKKKNPIIMNGEQYLEFEDWQTCGQFYGYTVRTHHAEPVEIDGVKGARAEADLVNVKTGEVIGGAEAYCMRDEEHWNTRPKYEWQGEGADRKRVKVGDEIVPWFQLASMAQTRAGAKAFRNRLAWVVVLAGYKPTPAEEMTENTVSEATKERRTVDKTSHYCPVHDVNFFKKGKMKGYAHPIEGTDKWCNEEDQLKKDVDTIYGPEPTEETKSDVPQDASGQQPGPVSEEVKGNDKAGFFNISDLKEKMKQAKWTQAQIVSWVKSKANYNGLDLSGKFEDIIGRMNKEQAEFLMKEVEDRR